MVSISYILVNESFSLLNPFFEDSCRHLPGPGATDINLAQAVATPHPSRVVQFMDAPSSKFKIHMLV